MTKANILGVDAGGSHCRAGLFGDSEEILSYSEGEGCNYQSSGIDSVRRTLTGLMEKVIEGRELPMPLECCVFGMAGLDTQRDRLILEPVIRESLQMARILPKTLIVENDAYVSLKGHLHDRPGLLVISGTGSILYGQDSRGRYRRIGGRGHIVGDDGSGFNIGLSAIQHVFRVADGVEPASAVFQCTLEELGLIDPDSLLDWLYSERYSPMRVANLATAVCDLARGNDVTARRILTSAAHSLANCASELIKVLGLGTSEYPFEVVMSGSVIKHSEEFRNDFSNFLYANAEGFTLTTLHDSPVYYAAIHGRRCIDALATASPLRHT